MNYIWIYISCILYKSTRWYEYTPNKFIKNSQIQKNIYYKIIINQDFLKFPILFQVHCPFKLISQRRIKNLIQRNFMFITPRN